MDVIRALEQRRMQRSFDGSSLEAEQVTPLLEASLLAPSAGHARGQRWMFALGASEVARWFSAATDERWRTTAPRAEGLARAAAACVLITDPSVYLDRYAEADKAASGLGANFTAWGVPYWFGDAGGVSLSLLLLAEEAGLAACFLGAFRRDADVRNLLGLSTEEQIYGTVLLGRSDGADRRSASLDRPGPTRAARVQRLGQG